MVQEKKKKNAEFTGKLYSLLCSRMLGTACRYYALVFLFLWFLCKKKEEDLNGTLGSHKIHIGERWIFFSLIYIFFLLFYYCLNSN